MKEYHFQIVNDLFKDPKEVSGQLNSLFNELLIKASQKGEYDFVYDQVIGFGEIISSTLVHNFFLSEELNSEWVDSRKYIHTDSLFAKVR